MTSQDGDDPDNPPPDDEGEVPSRPRTPPARAFTERGRVTLSFRGPRLALPDEPGGQQPEGGEEGSSPTSRELEGAQAVRPPLAPAQDAWTADRMARRSTPPHAAGATESEPPPTATAVPGAAAVPELAPLEPLPKRATDPPPAIPQAEGAADAFELVDRSHPSSPSLDLANEMADRYALGDFTGALHAAELLLGRDPSHEEANRYADSSRRQLEQLYVSRLGSPERVPRLLVRDSEVRWLGLDHRAGFLLSRIDGRHTIEEIVEVSAMARLEALKTLVQLLEVGAIELA